MHPFFQPEPCFLPVRRWRRRWRRWTARSRAPAPRASAPSTPRRRAGACSSSWTWPPGACLQSRGPPPPPLVPQAAPVQPVRRQDPSVPPPHRRHRRRRRRRRRAPPPLQLCSPRAWSWRPFRQRHRCRGRRSGQCCRVRRGRALHRALGITPPSSQSRQPGGSTWAPSSRRHEAPLLTLTLNRQPPQQLQRHLRGPPGRRASRRRCRRRGCLSRSRRRLSGQLHGRR